MPFGRYAILRKLGAGSMGTVYLSRDRGSGREVALKVIRTVASVASPLLELRKRPGYNLEQSQEVTSMTLEQLERKVIELEREIAELKREIRPLRPFKDTADTFGIFADDPDFDEVVRLGREFRDQINSENG